MLELADKADPRLLASDADLAGPAGWRERSGSEAKFEQFVRSYRGRYPNVVSVLDARRMAREPHCTSMRPTSPGEARSS